MLLSLDLSDAHSLCQNLDLVLYFHIW